MKKHRDPNDRRQVEARRKEDRAVGEFSVTGVRFEGPLPPPAVLSGYNQALTDGAERIFRMAEKNQEHRHELETKVIEGNVRAQSRGQWFMFFISVLAITGGVYLISIGKDATGLGIIIGDLVGLVGLFVYADVSKKKELRDKGTQLTKPLSGP
ncbi:MAG TPA: DUF2335 domain-containing protein [Thermoanaerobaculia bacterium]|nr:DUF2335 domain-containing protein [Thermoanaerobaculia bacterium]